MNAQTIDKLIERESEKFSLLESQVNEFHEILTKYVQSSAIEELNWNQSTLIRLITNEKDYMNKNKEEYFRLHLAAGNQDDFLEKKSTI